MKHCALLATGLVLLGVSTRGHAQIMPVSRLSQVEVREDFGTDFQVEAMSTDFDLFNEVVVSPVSDAVASQSSSISAGVISVVTSATSDARSLSVDGSIATSEFELVFDVIREIPYTLNGEVVGAGQPPARVSLQGPDTDILFLGIGDDPVEGGGRLGPGRYTLSITTLTFAGQVDYAFGDFDTAHASVVLIVPEPTTLMFIGISGLTLIIRRRHSLSHCRR